MIKVSQIKYVEISPKQYFSKILVLLSITISTYFIKISYMAWRRA